MVIPWVVSGSSEVAVPAGYVSLRAFARQHGVALSAVQKAVESGRVTAVTRDADGWLTGIHLEEGWAQWQRNTDAAEALKSGRFVDGRTTEARSHLAERDAGLQASLLGDQGEDLTAARAALPDKPSYPENLQDPAVDPDGVVIGFNEHRAKREKFLAAQAELEYLERIAKLVSADEVRKVAYKRYRMLRDKILNVPDRVATLIAAERDPVRVHQILTQELKTVLSALAGDAREEAERSATEPEHG